MERLDLTIPKDFRYGKELGMVIASQISQAIEKGVLHFKSGSYEELSDIALIMKAIQEDGCVLSWHSSYGPQSMGIHSFGKEKFKQISLLIPITKEIYSKIESRSKAT